ncbi:MAG: lipopolysaccharide biosynthesis protein [Firmicutes bacterium]|nr:lipopolysaccharide biosynthesis protein [Bacillota bacterium]
MLESIRKILGKTKNVKRSAYIWNAVNAIVSALQNPVILLVMTRTNGISDAGVFSIAFAIATLMLYIGLYGLRRFQSSDINEKYSFAQYHGMRILSCSVMMAACGVYCAYGVVFSGYSVSKAAVIMMICVVKCCQAYSDVYHGRMQQKGRLDVATKSSTFRYLLELVVYAAALAVTHDIIISTAAFMAASIAGLLLTSVNAGRDFGVYRPEFNGFKLKNLAVEGFPIFVSLFLNMYISNAPKYAIDRYLTEEDQAVYNMIFMPAFAVMLISNFIFNPIITTYAELWNDDNKKSIARLKKKVFGQCMLVAAITAFGLLVAATIGCPVLSIIFGVDLTGYRLELCIVMVGGGALAYTTYFSTILTVIRKQNTLLVSYGIIAVAARVMSGFLVVNYGMLGATGLYAILMTLLALGLGVIVYIGINQHQSLSSRGHR